jgi:phytoene dehydrogenase-like protein
VSKVPTYDAIVIGAGPNGLAAAVTLARAGKAVLVLEAAETVGGGTRTAELTLPGFRHDVCSAVHPLAASSAFFRSLPLADYGLKWIQSPAPLAHPLDEGTAVLLDRSLEITAAALGQDGGAYRRLIGPLVARWSAVTEDLLGPSPIPPHHPVALAWFGLEAILPATALARLWFRKEQSRALFAGMAAHSILPLDQPGSAAYGLILAMAGHAVGWPIAQGGSQAIADALASYLLDLGGEILTGHRVTSLASLPPAQALLFDVSPINLVSIANDRLPAGYRRKLERYRHGPAAFKVDWALDGAIPWTASACLQAGTVHLGGSLQEIARSERAAWQGVHPDRPYIILSQPSLFDPTRAPDGKHTAWAYCHVPNLHAAPPENMAERIEVQVERFAPGFRKRILARHVMTPADFEAYNPNYVGGDIIGGAQNLSQFFSRPVLSLNPYATPAEGIYLCSASTPPGGGVHGMCGYHAAQAVLRTRKGFKP